MFHKLSRACLYLILTGVVLASMTYCRPTPEPISDYGTGAIYATMHISTTDGYSVVEVELAVNASNGAELFIDNSDSLIAQMAGGQGQQLTLSEEASLFNNNRQVYATTLTGDDPDVVITITLNRITFNSAISTVALPKEITLQQPSTGATFGPQDQIIVDWSPHNIALVLIHFDMRCSDEQHVLSQSKNFSADDDASVTYSVATDLLGGWDLSTLSANASCQTTISLQREPIQGSVSQEFHGGIIDATRTDSISVIIIP